MPAATDQASERRSAATSAQSTSAAASSWSTISRLTWTSCQTRYGFSVDDDRRDHAGAARQHARADRVDEQRGRRRDEDLREADRPPLAPEDPVDRDEEEAVERLRVRRRLARDEAERPVVDERRREVVALVRERREDLVALVHEDDHAWDDRRERRRATGERASRGDQAPAPRRARAPRARASGGTRGGGRGRRDRARARRGAARPCPRGTSRGRVASTIARELAQVVAEPAAERDAEAALPARRDVGEAGRRRTRGAARPSPRGRGSSAVGQREPELDDLVVEERRAQLERVRHRRDVRLQQQVAGQVRREVEQPAGRRSPCAGGSKRTCGRVPRIEPQLPAASSSGKTSISRRVALAARRRRRRRGTVRRGRARARLAPRRTGAAARRGCGPRARRAGHALGERRARVALVAGERLVAAVAGERDRHVAARLLGDQERRERRLVARAARRTRRRAAAASRRRPRRAELLVHACRSAAATARAYARSS